MPNSRSSLGSLERSVMDVMWDDPSSGGLTVREVLDRLETKRPLAYTTVMTVLARLAEKGTLERTRDGRAWRYRTTTTRQQLTAEAMRDPLGELDQEQRTSAILHFIEDATEDELASLRAALDAVEARAAGEHGATTSS